MKNQAPNEIFRFRSPTQVVFGEELYTNLASTIKNYDFKRLVCVKDKGATENDYAERYSRILMDSFDILFLDGPAGEPDLEYLEHIRGDAKEFNPDAIIGFGGGSAIDSAKGAAIVVNNVKHSSAYQGFDLMENPGLPCITIPTLFGAGTEVTASAVFINKENQKKGGINGELVFPKLALLDPGLSLTAPKALIGATGLDALVHAIEGYVAQCATCLSRIFSLEAVKVLLPALQFLSKDCVSVEALKHVAFGSFLAINGLMHSESGICGAISYPLGVFFNVPHGLAGGLVMPKAIEINKKRGATIYERIEKEVGGNLSTIIQGLIDKFALKSLRNFGLDEEKAKGISSEVYTYKLILEMNPVELNSEDIFKIICSAI